MGIEEIKRIVNQHISGLDIKKVFEYDKDRYILITSGDVDNVLMLDANTEKLRGLPVSFFIAHDLSDFKEIYSDGKQ